ncbi:RNA polymerase sigma-70 factor, ECF subfamily [Geosporobacter subterraneus DSM 17957]|uniref:RNA polymerase sigma-70 factor, ECF subfamily n=1 Tax=Geosporobacter subterraneus DSM 17957 TaxID=1121919 RepID=A0A1M6MW10_9FIRM|nr:RNA polymerase sigma factor [Geosporobacter subterraneus]SHJ87590.1 RNA polymerase sigma-70 factor, ECF subfamily [Geosporobacter subterraneus DSM 17957]
MVGFFQRKNQVDKELLLKMLFDTHKEKVYRIAYSILKNEYDAKDVVQDTFITVYEKIGELRDKERITSWICTIACNMAKAKYNKRKREVLFDIEDKVIPFKDVSEDFNIPEQLLLQKEFREYLLNYIADLSNPHAEVLQLYYFADLSYEEISKALAISMGTVKSRISRGKDYLKVKIESDKHKFLSLPIKEGYSHVQE